jgi:subtilase family serine protease
VTDALPTPVVSPVPQTAPLSSSVPQTTTFSMPLENVSDDLIQNTMEGNTIPVLSPVKNANVDISSIVAPENAQIDPVLKQDLSHMEKWLAKAAETDTPFIDVVSKSQKKKNVQTLQKTSLKTRSRANPPPFK